MHYQVAERGGILIHDTRVGRRIGPALRRLFGELHGKEVSCTGRTDEGSDDRGIRSEGPRVGPRVGRSTCETLAMFVEGGEETSALLDELDGG